MNTANGLVAVPSDLDISMFGQGTECRKDEREFLPLCRGICVKGE